MTPLFTILVSAIIGFLCGWASWRVAEKLTAGAREDRLHERLILLLAGVCGGGLLAVSAVRSGGDVRTVVTVAVLAAPLLITLLTDLRARLVFPGVLLPGALSALAIAATGRDGVFPALITGGAVAAVTGALVVLAHRIWSSQESPLGSGDILVTGAIGVALGPDDTPRTLFAGMIVAAIAAALLMLTRRAGRNDVIPYGAFLCGSALITLAVQGRG